MPTRKQRQDQDDKQRNRVRKQIEQNVGAVLGQSFGDSMARLKGVTDTEWQAAVKEEDAIIAQADKKGPGKGWWGPPRGTHGKLSGILSGFSEEQEIELQETAQLIPDRHLEGLGEITSEPSRWLTGADGKWIPPEGSAIVPSGEYESGKIRLNPDRFVSGDLLHEMGHHVCRNVSKGTIEKVQTAIRTSLMDYYYNEALGRKGPTLADLGLRPYSIGNPLELLADAYHLWHKGSDEQWNALTKILGKSGLDLDAAFDRGKELD